MAKRNFKGEDRKGGASRSIPFHVRRGGGKRKKKGREHDALLQPIAKEGERERWERSGKKERWERRETVPPPCSMLEERRKGNSKKKRQKKGKEEERREGLLYHIPI